MSEIFVNTVNYNGSKTAKLMRLFTVNDAYSIEFPVTSKLKAMLKSSEGGARVMNELLEKLISDEKREQKAENFIFDFSLRFVLLKMELRGVEPLSENPFIVLLQA